MLRPCGAPQSCRSMLAVGGGSGGVQRQGNSKSGSVVQRARPFAPPTPSACVQDRLSATGRTPGDWNKINTIAMQGASGRQKPHRAPPTCDPKVSQLDVPVPIDQDVACLDVSMDVPIAVDVRQRAQRLRREGEEGGVHAGAPLADGQHHQQPLSNCSRSAGTCVDTRQGLEGCWVAA